MTYETVRVGSRWALVTNYGNQPGSRHGWWCQDKKGGWGTSERSADGAIKGCVAPMLYRSRTIALATVGEPQESDAEKLLRFTRTLASYDCAGVGQDTDDTAPCGQCAVCEAGDFLDRRATNLARAARGAMKQVGG